MPKRRYLGIEAKDYVLRTGSSSKKRARLLEKLQTLIGRARFLAVREQLPDESNDYDERESLETPVKTDSSNQ
jgi:hypothetical protein